ncbi:SagB/ThcOx family dehydrogenase [Paenibacillus sp. KN14-4R]|uniref:SagB/ThcOx family dehydrogenase n=1 Tax=Paenibacillus sp. KN14-4R TaxID=3445773 RepID=UPI003FA17B76
MSLELFLHNLHFDVDKTKPPDLVVDWEDGPLAYKLYRGLPMVPLSHEIPLTLDDMKSPEKVDLRLIGHFLWYVFGVAQLSQVVFPSLQNESSRGVLQMYRRFAPSGGALYPSECYLYLKIEDLPMGIYHYDAAHHRLVLLREGYFDSYMTRALGHQCELSDCFGAVFVSTMFWKNFFKYNDFSYRLQGLDAGVMSGQLQEVAKRFGITTGVIFQFMDRAINQLLGLSEQEESVYAVIPLSLEPTTSWFFDKEEVEETITATELSKEITSIHLDHYVRSKRVREYPMLIRMNEASMIESLQSSPSQIGGKNIVDCEYQTINLPAVQRLSYDLAWISRKRHSPDRDFVMGKVSQKHLAELLQEAMASFLYTNDLDGSHERSAPRVSLYVCLHNVEDIPDGAYRYDSFNHSLARIRPGDHRFWLQLGLSTDNVNLEQVPLCFHVAGDKDHLTHELGYRGYRIQQMEAGMLVQRLVLAASAIGMGGHPLLGYDARLSDEIYKMPERGLTSLIQIPVGFYRPSARLEGGLHG